MPGAAWLPGAGPDRNIPLEEYGPLPVNDAVDDDEATEIEVVKDEGPIALALQAFPSVSLSCVGLLLAGWLLNIVQYWPAFRDIPQFFILVPVLLNLKGNLEMTLSARLSTAANTGALSRSRTRNSTMSGNLVLLQVQAVTVGTVAACLSLVIDGINTGEWGAEAALLVISSSVASAATASIVLGSVMCAVVYLCYRLRLNPDNIATPLAASMGDLLTLYLLGVIGGRMYENDRIAGAGAMLAVFLVLLLPAFFYTWRHAGVRPVLVHGWLPLIIAMLIASASGFLLEGSVQEYPGMAMIVPFMNGLGGSIASIYASRRSTFLHAGVRENARAAQLTLFLLQLPILATFLLVIGLDKSIEMSGAFLFMMIVVGQLQAAILLPMAHALVRFLWKHGKDPDDYALPIVSATGDVVGTALLIFAYQQLGRMGYLPAAEP